MIFRAILNQDNGRAIAILDQVFILNPGFKNKDNVNIDLIRDCGRILSLKLCSQVTTDLLRLQNNED